MHSLTQYSMVRGGGRVDDITYQFNGGYETTLGEQFITTLTVPSFALGVASSARRVVVLITHESINGDADTVTIGGVSATLISVASNQSYWHALVPSGTTGTIVINWSSAGDMRRLCFACYSIYNASISDLVTTSNAFTNPVVVDVPFGGVLLYVSNLDGDSSSPNIVGVTEDFRPSSSWENIFAGSKKFNQETLGYTVTNSEDLNAAGIVFS